MIENYQWQDLRHAVGFAAACARVALKHYSGEHRADLVAAIQIAERCAAGEAIDPTAAYVAARAAAVDATDATTHASDAAAYAAYAAVDATDAAVHAADADAAVHAADSAARAAILASARAVACVGIDQAEIDALWRGAVAQDLGATPGGNSYYAACAALSTGDLDLAREITTLAESEGK